MYRKPATRRPGKGLPFLLAGILLLPGLAQWAVTGGPREQKRHIGNDFLEPARDFGFSEPVLTDRAEGLAPLAGVPFDPDLGALREPDALFTSTGVFRVGRPDNQRHFPADLRTEATLPGRGAGLRPNSLHYAILTPAGRQRAGEIETALATAGVSIVGLVRNGYLLWVPAPAVSLVRNSDWFLALSPMPAAHKIAPDTGIRPFIERDRARSRELHHTPSRGRSRCCPKSPR